MARHTDELPLVRDDGRAGRRGGRRRRLLVPVLAALTVVALAGGAVVAGSRWAGTIRERLASAPLVGAECPSNRRSSTTLSITVAPEISLTVQRIIGRVNGRELSDGSCLDVSVTSQSPAQTVAGSAILPVDRAPHLWIPDSSLWAARGERWKMKSVGAFASSPVVLATSSGTIAAQDWEKEPPTWQAALTGKLPVAAPDIGQDSASMVAMLALVQSTAAGPGGSEAAGEALAAAVLATKRAGVPSVNEALAAAQAGSPTAPLIPLTEQAVLGVTAGINKPKMTAIYPKGASPFLDYPLMQIDALDTTSERREAITVVRNALLSPWGQQMVIDDGLRDGHGTAPAGVSKAASSVRPSPALPANQVAAFLKQVVALSVPTRLLAVVDVSGSMVGPAGDGSTRSQFAATSAKIAGELMPDVAQVGVWGFSRDLSGTRNWIEFQPVAELGARNGDVSHRQAVYAALDAMPSRLGGNGTAIYATTVAAMKKMRGLYSPRAANAVVVMTDGVNEDPGGPSLAEAVNEIKRLHNPQRPIRLIMIGIGPDADVQQLQKLAAPTGGAAYQAQDPRMLPKVLLKTMTQRNTS